MESIKKLSIVCGVIDATVIFLVVLTLAAAAGKTPPILLQQNPGLVLGYLLPFCVITAWRGTAHTKNLINGHRGWLRPAVEGFFAGFLPIPFIQTIGMLSEAASAAGPNWPSLGHVIEGEWTAFFLWLLQMSSITGSVGTVCGLSLSGVNRLVIWVWRGLKE